MFYNRNAVLLKQVFSGEFVEALRERREGYYSRGWGDGATPLAEETVRERLDEYGLAVRSGSGIRIFHDHLPEDARSRDRLDGLSEVQRAAQARAVRLPRPAHTLDLRTLAIGRSRTVAGMKWLAEML